ncbi:MAG: dCTP deaminase [Desulfurococcaceae archaeon]|jgi:dCTP deaminase|nr:dCTP deaminase [Desulfurococcaceae archaeon]
MILSDFDLTWYLKSGRLVIVPYDEEIVRENGIDLRIGGEIAKLKSLNKVFDTRNVTEEQVSEFYEVLKSDEFVIYPNERVLLTTLEYVKLPNDIMGFVELRSSFARLGLTIPPTIIDAGFEGNVTLEVHGSTFPIKLYKGQRFAHVIFSKTLNPVLRPYQGKYQGQRGVTLPKF